MKRRTFLNQLAIAGGVAAAASPMAARLAHAADELKRQQRHCVILWMAGGPSQTDTFDMKPKHANGGGQKEIATNTPGIRFSEDFSRLAQFADQMAIMRGVSTKEGDHLRGTKLMRTGHTPGGPVAYPEIGCSLSASMQEHDAALPRFVSIGATPFGRSGPGFLGPRFAATGVNGGYTLQDAINGTTPQQPTDTYAELTVDFLNLPAGVDRDRHEKRVRLWRMMQQKFRETRNAPNVITQDTVYESALRMVDSTAKQAFELDREPDAVRDRYGKGVFGQGCL
ncbi:MAG: DUF1501 domain-containing protein, partial [Planctomycetota bacterium]